MLTPTPKPPLDNPLSWLVKHMSPAAADATAVAPLHRAGVNRGQPVLRPVTPARVVTQGPDRSAHFTGSPLDKIRLAASDLAHQQGEFAEGTPLGLAAAYSPAFVPQAGVRAVTAANDKQYLRAGVEGAFASPLPHLLGGLALKGALAKAGVGVGTLGALTRGADESRAPIRAFHATDAEFVHFDPSKIGSTTDAGHLGRAFYFSTDPRIQTIGRTKPAARLMERDLALSNPLEIAFPAWHADKRALVREALALPPDASAGAVTKAARAQGHDGIVLDYSPVGYNHREIAVFDPEKISRPPPQNAP